jgi:hypothetical protein
MIDQIRRYDWRTVTSQVSGRGANHHPIRTEIFRHQIGVVNIANTDRQIEALIDEIDHPVSQIQFDANIRPRL